MGYTTNSNLIIPWGIGLYPIADATSATAGVTEKQAANPAGVNSSSAYTIGWHADSSNSLFQVQWRWQRRLNPAQALVIEPGGSELWYGWDGADLSSGTQGTLGEYGAWQGNTLSGETATVSMPRGGGAANPDRTFYLWNSDTARVIQLAIPYDMSDYDAARLEIQVRTFTFPLNTDKPVSNWGSAVVTIGFEPTTTTTAERNADGSVTVSVQTNLTRGGNLVQFPAFYADGTELGGGISAVVEDDFTVTIPAEYAPTDTLQFSGATITTADGISANTWATELGGAIQELPITEIQPGATIPQPTVTVDADGNVTVSGSGYDGVAVRVSYVDEEGNSYSEVVDMVQDGDTWTGTMQTPPLDVVVDVTTVCTVGDDWKGWTQGATVDSHGLVMFDWPGSDGLRIRYNPDRQLTVDLMGDVVSIQGAALPKSRHSTSRTSSMTMTGTLINPAEDSYNGDAWLAQLEVFNEPHDWIFRTPNGLRRRVSVESYTPAWATQSANRIMQVTINMQEVQG